MHKANKYLDASVLRLPWLKCEMPIGCNGFWNVNETMVEGYDGIVQDVTN